MLRFFAIALIFLSLFAATGCGGGEKGKNKDYDRPKSTEGK